MKVLTLLALVFALAPVAEARYKPRPFLHCAEDNDRIGGYSLDLYVDREELHGVLTVPTDDDESEEVSATCRDVGGNTSGMHNCQARGPGRMVHSIDIKKGDRAHTVVTVLTLESGAPRKPVELECNDRPQRNGRRGNR